MSRLYANFAEGTLTSGVTTGDLTFQSAEFSQFLPAISAPDELWIVMDPEGANPEIVAITAYDGVGTSATVERSKDGTGAVAWGSGTAWKCDVTRGGLQGLGDGSLIGDATILNRHLAIDAVGQAQLQNNVVGPNELASGAVGQTHIQNDAILNDMIVDGTIEQSKLAGGASIPPDSVGTAELQDGAVSQVKIQNGAVGASQLATAPGEISNVHISDSAQISQTKLSLGIPWQTADIGDGQVTGAKIASNTITAGNIDTNAVGPSELAESGEYNMYKLHIDATTDVPDGNPPFRVGGTNGVQIDANEITNQGGSFTIGAAATRVNISTNDVRFPDIGSVAGGVPLAVFSPSIQQLYRDASSRKMKKNIKNLSGVDVAALQPRRFDIKAGFVPEGVDVDDPNLYGRTTGVCGFIAEEVEEIEPAFVFRNEDGEAEAINWNAITAALVLKVKELEAQL